MKLDKVEEDQIDQVTELWFQLAEEMEEYSELNRIDSTEEDAVEEFRKQLEEDKYQNYLIKENGETIGFLTLKHNRQPSREISDYTKIVNLYIKEGHSNQGYGSETIEKVREIAKENDSDFLKVSAEWNNTGARKFYRQNGFQQKQVEYTQGLD